MKHGFFAKLAWMGIRKNKRLYVPYILTCIAMVAMLYIMLFLHFDGQLELLPVGGNSAVQMMGFASWVIAIFSAIFLFYTNSFLMRRRKREFGLYNVLGMCKMDIARILVWENLIILCISLGCGLLCGILFSKLAQLGLFRLLGGELVWDFSLSLPAIGLCVAGFCAIFLLLLVHWLISIHLNNPIALMRAENVRREAAAGQLVLGNCRCRSVDRCICSCRQHQRSCRCARFLLYCCHYGHPRHLSAFCIWFRTLMPCVAKKQTLLLQTATFHQHFFYDLPHEAQRCRACFHLYSIHDGSGHPVLLCFSLRKHPSSCGNQQSVSIADRHKELRFQNFF